MDRDVEELLGLVPLEVGQRVRIRLSGECRSWYPPLECFGHVEPGFWTGHDAAADGLIGIIAGIFDDETRHPYSVTTDRHWTHRVGEAVYPINGDMFARSELERLP